jgi:hypothetical protein
MKTLTDPPNLFTTVLKALILSLKRQCRPRHDDTGTHDSQQVGDHVTRSIPSDGATPSPGSDVPLAGGCVCAALPLKPERP